MKTRSVARSGSRPLESTDSNRTGNRAAAADTMRGRKKRREVIGHDNAGPLSQRGEQSFVRIGLRFDIRKVQHAGILQRGDASGVLGHAVDHEAMNPIAGPPIPDSQRLEDHQRLSQLNGQLHRALQAEIRRQPPKRDHPIQDELTVTSDRSGIADSDARSWHHGLRSPLLGKSVVRDRGESFRQPPIHEPHDDADRAAQDAAPSHVGQSHAHRPFFENCEICQVVHAIQHQPE